MPKLSDEVVAAGLRELVKLRDGKVPSTQELEASPILTGWFVEHMDNGLQRLGGFVTGHPTIRPGWCWTSVVIYISKDRTWARTISRYYRLCDPLPLSGDG